MATSGTAFLFVVVLGIVIPVLLGALAIALGLRLAGFGRDNSHRILRERLARGEITPDEFETAWRILGG